MKKPGAFAPGFSSLLTAQLVQACLQLGRSSIRVFRQTARHLACPQLALTNTRLRTTLAVAAVHPRSLRLAEALLEIRSTRCPRLGNEILVNAIEIGIVGCNLPVETGALIRSSRRVSRISAARARSRRRISRVHCGRDIRRTLGIGGSGWS